MDFALASCNGLRVAEFAKRWRVSTRTVMRDLAAFRALGQRMGYGRDEPGAYRWHYDRGQAFLFFCNAPRRR
jgi:predicted DNA-binding transcriptional regulator YafY